MIDKVGAIIIENKKMLLARGYEKDCFFIPGGKREHGESDEECLRREIMEELSSEVIIGDFYGEFVAEAIGKPGQVKVRAYFCTLKTSPKPTSEIEQLEWTDSNFDKDKLGNILKVMVPKLKSEGRIS